MKVLQEKHISYSSSKKPLKNQKTKKQFEAEVFQTVHNKIMSEFMSATQKVIHSDNQEQSGG